MQVQSYLIFNGRCEEAIEFYKKTLGAKVEMLMRFSDNPEQPTEQSATGCAQIGDPNKIMHSSFRIGDTVQVRLLEAAPVAGALRFELLSEGSRVKPSSAKRNAKRPSQSYGPRGRRR